MELKKSEYYEKTKEALLQLEHFHTVENLGPDLDLDLGDLVSELAEIIDGKIAEAKDAETIKIHIHIWNGLIDNITTNQEGVEVIVTEYDSNGLDDERQLDKEEKRHIDKCSLSTSKWEHINLIHSDQLSEV